MHKEIETSQKEKKTGEKRFKKEFLKLIDINQLIQIN